MLRTILKKGSTPEDVFSAFDSSYYPKKLYKYRSCDSEYSFDILENDYLWADSPENFFDPFDSIVNTNQEEMLFSFEKTFIKHINEFVYFFLPEEEKVKHSFEEFSNFENDFIDESGEYKRSNARKILAETERKMSKEKKNEWENIKQYIADSEIVPKGSEALKLMIKELRGYLRKSAFVCCLSQNGENMKMWEDYADKYSGFMIEYSLDKCDDLLLKTSLCRMFPVKYYKKIPKFDFSDIIEWCVQKVLFDKNTDILNAMVELYKQLLYKKFEYASEEEWRIIVSKNESQRIEFPFASAVYAGYKITEENFEKLKNICDKKGIPLYKQELDSLGGEFVYYSIDVSED